LVIVSADVPKWGGVTNLLGVDYLRTLPAETEFPRRVSKLDVFVRFFPRGSGPETLAVEVWWLNDDGTEREKVHTYLQEVPFANDEERSETTCSD